MQSAAETLPSAAGGGYSFREAAVDLVEGAFRARRPARRRGSEPLPWPWQVALVGLSGLVSSLDVYLREPFTLADLPAGWEGALPVLRVVGNPLVALLVSLGCWLFGALGGWVVAFGRSGSLKRIAGGAAFGFWCATLPNLVVIVAGLLFGLKSDTIAILVMVLVTGHVVPSVAEACDVTIGRAFGLVVLGPLALILLIAVVLFGFGLLGKFVGVPKL